MTKKLTLNDFFSSSDMTLSATLLYMGFKLEAIEKGQPKSSFIFKRDDGLDDAIQAFWAGEILIEPKRFFNCIKEVKSRLYQE